MAMRNFGDRFRRNPAMRPRQNFGGLICPKCDGKMTARSSPPELTYYKCCVCGHKRKVARPKGEG